MSADSGYCCEEASISGEEINETALVWHLEAMFARAKASIVG